MPILHTMKRSLLLLAVLILAARLARPRAVGRERPARRQRGSPPIPAASPNTTRACAAFQPTRFCASTWRSPTRSSARSSTPRSRRPISRWLQQHAAQDRILYIVLTKGIPLRIKGTPGRDGTRASVDSELTLLYRRMTGADATLAGRLANPYFLGATPVEQATTFNHKAFDLYLVTRLDGYTVEDVIGLIDRGAAPVQEGRILLDQRAAPPSQAGNAWLKSGADRLTAGGFGSRVTLDTSPGVVTGEKNLLGYYSWGSNDRGTKTRRLGLGFVPGAIAGMYVSTDARTFTEPPAALDDRHLDRPGHVLRRLSAVADGRSHSRGRHRRRRARGRAVPRCHDSARHPVPGLPVRLQPGRVVLSRDALPELADGGRRRPALRAVPAEAAAGGRHRQGHRPGHRAARATSRRGGSRRWRRG